MRGSSPTHIQPPSANEELKRECSQLQQQLRTHVVSENKLKEKCQRSVELIKDFLKKEVRKLTIFLLFRILNVFHTIIVVFLY